VDAQAGEMLGCARPVGKVPRQTHEWRPGDDKLTVLAGAAYVLTRTGDARSQQATVKASNTGAFDSFGHLAVGAWFEGSAAKGIDGYQSNDFATGAGESICSSGRPSSGRSKSTYGEGRVAEERHGI
jgi:hypothetical protein